MVMNEQGGNGQPPFDNEAEESRVELMRMVEAELRIQEKLGVDIRHIYMEDLARAWENVGKRMDNIKKSFSYTEEDRYNELQAFIRELKEYQEKFKRQEVASDDKYKGSYITAPLGEDGHDLIDKVIVFLDEGLQRWYNN